MLFQWHFGLLLYYFSLASKVYSITPNEFLPSSKHTSNWRAYNQFCKETSQHRILYFLRCYVTSLSTTRNKIRIRCDLTIFPLQMKQTSLGKRWFNGLLNKFYFLWFTLHCITLCELMNSYTLNTHMCYTCTLMDHRRLPWSLLYLVGSLTNWDFWNSELRKIKKSSDYMKTCNNQTESWQVKKKCFQLN